MFREISYRRIESRHCALIKLSGSGDRQSIRVTCRGNMSCSHQLGGSLGSHRNVSEERFSRNIFLYPPTRARVRAPLLAGSNVPPSSHTLSPSASLVSTFSSSEHSLRRKRNLRDMDLGGHCPPGSGTLPPKPLSGI